MLRRVHLTRFRGFENLSLDLRPVTVLVGPNSSGKTSVLQSIRLCLQLLEVAWGAQTPLGRVKRAARTEVRVTQDALVPDLAQLLPLLDWQAMFPRSKTGENTELKIALDFDVGDDVQRIETVLRCGRNSQLKLSAWVMSRKALAQVQGVSDRSSQVNAQLREFLAPRLPRALFIPPFYGVVREEEFRAGPLLDRMLGGGDQSHIVRNLVMRLSPEALERLNSALDEEIGVRISERTTEFQRESTHPLRVMFRGGNGPLEVSAAGAGVINLMAILATLERYRSEGARGQVIFLFDELEAHLHPRLQGRVADRIATAVRSFGGQLVLASHFVELINQLARRDDGVVVRVDRTQPEPAVLDTQNALVQELMGWADLTPFSLVNFLASRRILFCEGRSDRAVLERCAAVYFRDDPRRLERFRQWTLVELTGSGNRSIPDLLTQVLRAHLIPTSTEDPPVRIVTLLDRDAVREPGTRTTTGPRSGVQAEETVWSRHSIENILLHPDVLAAWVRAFCHDALPSGFDLAKVVREAVETADHDRALTHKAQITLTLPLAQKAHHGKGELFSSNTIVHAAAEAAEMVRQNPEVWQRGHDRSQVVLGAVRAALPPAARATFPVDVTSLVERTPADRVGDPSNAVPDEIRALLDRMTIPAA